jgi:hypothetical protein
MNELPTGSPVEVLDYPHRAGDNVALARLRINGIRRGITYLSPCCNLTHLPIRATSRNQRRHKWKR